MTISIRQGSRLHKLPTGQHLLIDAIWRKFNGLRACAKKLDIPEYQLNMWRKRGKVPIKYVAHISSTLGVPKEALNFIEVSSLFGKDNSWKETVEACGLEKAVTTKILKGIKPRL